MLACADECGNAAGWFVVPGVVMKARWPANSKNKTASGD